MTGDRRTPVAVKIKSKEKYQCYATLPSALRPRLP
jgi:hypothetical protein